MRIAMAGQTWGPENGPGVFSRRLALRLAERGHAVAALVPARRMRSEWRDDGAVVVTGIPALSLAPIYPEVRVTPAPFRAVRRALEQFRPDVVHVQDHYPLCRAVIRAARRMQIPIVASNHFLPGNMLPHMRLIGRFGITERFLWHNLAAVFDRADLVVTPTETAAAILRPHLHVEVRAISCGIDLERFRPPTAAERTRARERCRIGADDIVFVYVGRLDREKRLEVLIEAVSRLRERVRLIVAGRGRHEAALRTLAAKRFVNDRVAFCGFISDSDLERLLCAADFFVMPSDVELQSIAALEAMATGLPVMAADAAALPELVESGVNGALFRPGDPDDAAEKMEMLAASRPRWPEMSRASRLRAERHSIEATVAAYEEIYEALGARPNASSITPARGPRSSASHPRRGPDRKSAPGK